jgi:hypothetical protein
MTFVIALRSTFAMADEQYVSTRYKLDDLERAQWMRRISERATLLRRTSV